MPKARLVPFLAECIKDPVYNPAIIKWLNEEEGVFLLVKPNEIARMWGERKGNSRMNYPSMSRGIRLATNQILQKCCGLVVGP